MPYFGAAEYVTRVAAVRAEMERAGLDIVIGFESNDKLTGGNARYLVGVGEGPLPAPCYVVLGLSGPLCLVVMENRAETVGNHARSFSAPGVEVLAARGNWASTLADALESVRASGLIVGVDGAPVDGPVLTQVRNAAPHLGFRQASKLIDRARRNKTPAELEACTTASSIAGRVYNHLKSIVEPGMPHQLAAAEASYLTAREGGEELVLALGSGRPWVWSSAAPTRAPGIFEDGEPVSCEVNVRYKGYFSQVARSWPVGTVSPLRQRMIDAVADAHEYMVAVVKPGAVPREVFSEGLRAIKRHGFDYHGIRYGHGLGLTIGEGWDFADDEDSPTGTTRSPLSATAYAVCHPFLFERAGDGTVLFNALYGDPWIMSTDGAVRV